MKPELLILGFALMGISAVFVSLFLRAFYYKTFTKALIFKELASLCFVALGGGMYLSGEMSIPKILIFIGLCCGIIGDELIALCQVFPKKDKRAFLLGGVCFIIGHVLYLVALFWLGKINWIGLVLGAAILVTLGVLYERKKEFIVPELKRSSILYFTIVNLFATVAIGVFFGTFGLGFALFAIGGILFVVSDNLLFAYKYGKEPKFYQNIVLHVAYYLAQFAIAWSIALI